MFFRVLIIVLAGFAVAIPAFAEMQIVSPSKVVLEGADLYGNDAYRITFLLERSDSRVYVKSAEFRIKGKSYFLKATHLSRVKYLDYAALIAKHDVGLRGDFFQFSIPYTNEKECPPPDPKVVKNRVLISHDEGDTELNVSYWQDCGRT